jgi:hypothetical protein
MAFSFTEQEVFHSFRIGSLVGSGGATGWADADGVSDRHRPRDRQEYDPTHGGLWWSYCCLQRVGVLVANLSRRDLLQRPDQTHLPDLLQRPNQTQVRPIYPTWRWCDSLHDNAIRCKTFTTIKALVESRPEVGSSRNSENGHDDDAIWLWAIRCKTSNKNGWNWYGVSYLLQLTLTYYNGWVIYTFEILRNNFLFFFSFF